MAGIGFELKKAFNKKGIIALLKAYGYSGLVCTGPMILGIVLLLGIRMLGIAAHATKAELGLLNAMVTYTLLFSLVMVNILAMVTTRYIADCIYMKKEEDIMPSFYGSISCILLLGCPIWGIFLHFSGVSLSERYCCYIFFGELVIVWTEINYLTAIKNYREIMKAFLVAVTASLVVGYIFGVKLHILPTTMALLASMCIGYGIMGLWYYVLLTRYFPRGRCSAMKFLKWLSAYPELGCLGICMSIGLYGHIVLMWSSPINNCVKGLFFEAPQYDVPALLSFLSILITTINFVTSVEVEFYPKYRNFFGLLNSEMTYSDIEQARIEMEQTLTRELSYTFLKQFFSTLIFIILGTFLIPKIPLGFNEDMLGIYNVLCCAYAFYAIGNATMLIQLYFADNTGALISGAVFMIFSFGGTFATIFLDIKWYGFGFLLGSFLFAVVSLLQLKKYLSKILENVLSRQPIKNEEVDGIMSRFADKCEKVYRDLYRKDILREEEE
ncbi:MAG: exopolysaccharide Pel transporter PelG [Eubacterium sp.]|nr:exopolysaccharide Pel transporter PelG [Eubacterium sp.]